VAEEGGLVALAGEPVVAPLAQRDHHREEPTAHRREDVVVPLAGLVVGAAFEDAGLHQRVEPAGQHVAGDAEAFTEVVEAGDAQEGVAQDEQGPPLADHLQRPGDRAVHVLEGGSSHRATP
jgi:hypothetical protein